MEELFCYYGIDNVNKERYCMVYAYDHEEALSKIASELKTSNVRVWKKEKEDELYDIGIECLGR